MRLHALHYKDNPKARVRDTVSVAGQVSAELLHCQCTGLSSWSLFLPWNHKAHGGIIVFNMSIYLDRFKLHT